MKVDITLLVFLLKTLLCYSLSVKGEEKIKNRKGNEKGTNKRKSKKEKEKRKKEEKGDILSTELKEIHILPGRLGWLCSLC